MLVLIKNLKKKRRNKIIVSEDEALHEKLMEDEIQILLKVTYRSNQSQGSSLSIHLITNSILAITVV